jgi:apolipoprotein N-acyltransferase
VISEADLSRIRSMALKKVYLLSVFSGILLSLPWLFPGLGWILFIAFIPLLLANDLIHKQNEKQNSTFFSAALITFLIWNVGSTWWIAYVSISGMLLIAILNALFMASVWWSGNRIQKHFGLIPGYFSLLVFWITFEFLQFNWTLQWPWLTLGNGLANLVKIIQWYEFTGVLGGSIWILSSNILIFLVFKNHSEKLHHKFVVGACSLLIIIGLPLILSCQLYYKTIQSGPTLDVSVLQPNIDPYTSKFSGMSEADQVRKLVLLADSLVSKTTDLIVAPETALPPLWEDSLTTWNDSTRFFGRLAENHPNASVIAGAITMRKFERGETVSETARKSDDGHYSYDCFNSALLFNPTKEIRIAHKRILVSGVEKLPFRTYFSFLERFTVDLGGTSGSLAAAEDATLFVNKNGVKIGPVICFESAFGMHSAELVRKGAQLLVVITNDGWWKDSPGCRQHFSYSRIRAIETRRCIARSANTGISGFINSRGDVAKESGLDSCEVLNSSLYLNDEITFYSRYGDFIGWICSFLTGMILINLLIRKGKLKWSF